MRLKRLELQGFKSFLDRTILSFDPGITGVVGPNGCGKSNIVDAIMWVMGEQSPKHLRGESMTDVIFNGSANKVASQMAEVSLILDKAGVALSPQFASFDTGEEVSITRRVFRDGSSEYLINKTPCRLKDVHELFMDTGVGRRAYSIIEQGQIDRMINVKPEERRSLFEEVAGVTKYKIKRKEAERKLEQTQGNLQRIQDIVTELEKQIRSLKIQATKAKKYREIKTELETIDLFILGRDFLQKKQEVESLEQVKQESALQRERLETSFSEVEARLTEVEVRKIDQEKIFHTSSMKDRELALELQKRESDKTLFQERRKFIEQNKTALEEEIFRLEEDKKNKTEERSLLQVEIERQIEVLRDLNEAVFSLEQGLRKETERKQLLSFQKSEVEKVIFNSQQKTVQLQTQISSQTIRAEEIESEVTDLLEKKESFLSVQNEQREKMTQAMAQIQACEEKTSEFENKVAMTHGEIDSLSKKLSQVENELFEVRGNYQNKSSKLESLRELKENLEGYAPSAKEALDRVKAQAISAFPLGELLRPSVELEDKLEFLLGNELNTVVVKTKDEAKIFSEVVTKEKLEQVKIIAIEEIPGRTELELLPENSILSQVTVTEGYEKIRTYLLGSVALCPDDASLYQSRVERPEWDYLSLESPLLAKSSHTLISGKQSSKTGVFTRKREMEELELESLNLSQSIEILEADRKQVLETLKSQEAIFSELKNSLSSLHLEKVELRKEKEKLQSETQRTVRDLEEVDFDVQSLQEQQETLQEQIVEARERSLALNNQIEQSGVELQAVENSFESLIKEQEQIQKNIQSKKIEQSALQEKHAVAKQTLERLELDLDLLGQRESTLAKNRRQEEEELNRLDLTEREGEERRVVVERDLKAIQVQLSEVQEILNELHHDLSTLQARKEEIFSEKSDLMETIQQNEIRLTQLQSQIVQIHALTQERYQRVVTLDQQESMPTIEQLPLMAESLNVTWDLLVVEEKMALLQEHLSSLKQKIERYGEVNLTSIHEFDEVQKRYDFLSTQKLDLDKSINILQEAIQKIDETTHLRFKDTFEAVNAKFMEIFPILFNGGKGELALTNPDNILESGVEVMVQPPGKRLQSISLLSGGEKALTAVSLVLSIFARKPSPFCLLDEVDAPLDDANVSRFNTVIKKMSEKTQFIVITHNKKTMEIAEALYGVTMEKMGVSKMTSVQLH